MIEQNNKTSKQDASKPGHDARQEVSELIKRHLINISVYSNAKLYDCWHRELISLFNLSRKYIPTDINEELDNLIMKIDNSLHLKGSTDRAKRYAATHNLELFLRKFTTKLYYFIQPLLMPITTDEDDELSIDGFFEGS